MKRKLYISPKLDLDAEKTLLISDFINFCCDELPIRGGCKIHIVSDREANRISTTAVYMVGQNDIRVYGKNRSLADVMRSVAHEMTHMMQDEQNLLHGNVRDAGGFHEDQANAKAGELLKLYAKKPGRRKIYESVKRSII